MDTHITLYHYIISSLHRSLAAARQSRRNPLSSGLPGRHGIAICALSWPERRAGVVGSLVLTIFRRPLFRGR